MHPLIAHVVDNVRSICQRRHVHRLDLFGSATTDEFDPAHSDLDFVVEFLPMTAVEHKDAYFGLIDDLEVVFGRKIDLVEPGAIRNPYFRASLERSRVNLYAAA
jgi:predicted nucleotidyltransferase